MLNHLCCELPVKVAGTLSGRKLIWHRSRKQARQRQTGIRCDGIQGTLQLQATSEPCISSGNLLAGCSRQKFHAVQLIAVHLQQCEVAGW